MASRTALRLLRLAREGDLAAQFELGSLYLCGGEGISANTDAALMWLERAAASGHREAIRTIARHIPPHATSGADTLLAYYELTAAEGDRAAALHAGLAWRMKTSPEADRHCRRYLSQAAEAGCSQSQLLLARMLDDGTASRAEGGEAEALLARAAQNGSPEALRALAERAWLKRDPGGIDLLRRVADKNDPLTSYWLGMMLRDKASSEQNSAWLAEAGQWLQHAADAGLAEARLEMGRMLAGLTPSPFKRNHKRAARLLELALAEGIAPAGLALFSLLDKTRGTQRNPEAALAALRRSAQLGLADSQYQLGTLLWSQLKRVKDAPLELLIECARWLHEARTQGHPDAPDALAAIASPAPLVDQPTRDYRHALLNALTTKHAGMAARLHLLALFGLQKHEALMIDPERADCGFCLALTPAETGRKRPRLVQIATSEQRLALDLAKRVLGSPAEEDADVSGPYPTRYRKLNWVAARFGIDWARFSGTR